MFFLSSMPFLNGLGKAVAPWSSDQKVELGLLLKYEQAGSSQHEAALYNSIIIITQWTVT